MSSTSTPKASIVIPAYNRDGTITGAIRSAQIQTFPQLEIVVVDDGSSDGTHETVTALVKEDNRIRYIRHSSNRGAQAARNTGIRAARGHWIAFLDSDDELLPDSLETRLELAERQQLKVVHSDSYVLRNNKGRSLFGVRPLEGNIYREVLSAPGPLFPALLVVKEVFEGIGYLDEALVAWQEWDTAIRLARYHEFGFVPQPTFIYDCRGQDTISKSLRRDAKGYEQIVKKHRLGILTNVGPELLAYHYQMAAKRYRMANDNVGRRRCQRLAFLWRLLQLSSKLFRVKGILPVLGNQRG